MRIMVEYVDVSQRAAAIEYAIRDVVVPAIELEKQGNEIIRLNIGDPLAYEGLPTPEHMITAYKRALDSQDNGYGPSYGIPSLRQAIAKAESGKGWDCSEDDVYVTHGVLSGEAIYKIKKSLIKKLVITDSIDNVTKVKSARNIEVLTKSDHSWCDVSPGLIGSRCEVSPRLIGSR